MTSKQKCVKDQIKAINTIADYVCIDGEKRVGLYGKGGCGKTYCSEQIVKDIRKIKRIKKDNIFFAAVSHQAVNNLSDSCNEYWNALTLAKFFQLKRQVSNTGKVTYEPQKGYYNKHGFQQAPVLHCQLLVIDECSMIGTKYHRMLEEYLPSSCIVIFLGDYCQSPPPDENRKPDTDSVTFNYPSYTLKHSYRYEGELLKFNDEIRKEIKKFYKKKPYGFDFMKKFFNSYTGTDLHFHRNPSVFFDSILDSARKDENFVSIAYRNKTISKMSNRIREEIIDSTEEYWKGDILVCNKTTYRNGSPLITNARTYKITEHVKKWSYTLFYNKKDPFVRIKEIGCPLLAWATQKQAGKYIDLDNVIPIHCTGYDLNLEDNNVKVLHSNSIDEWRKYLDAVKAYCKRKKNKECWKSYYEMEDEYSDLSYAQAVNVYKVQGSTYEKAYIYLDDITSVGPISIKEKLQAFYTACTRASTELHIFSNKI